MCYRCITDTCIDGIESLIEFLRVFCYWISGCPGLVSAYIIVSIVAGLGLKTKEFKMSGDIYTTTTTTMLSLHNSQKAQINIVEYFDLRFKVL